MTTSEKRQSAIEFIQNKNNATISDYKGLLIIESDLTLAIFKGKSAIPRCNYRFSTKEDKAEYLDKRKRSHDSELEQTQRWIDRNMKEAEQYQPGTICYASWGYEQTNIDFYKIVERKNSTLTIQAIGSKRNYGENFNDRGTCMPDAGNEIGEPFKKRIGKRGYVKLNGYSTLSLFDGSPLGWSSYA